MKTDISSLRIPYFAALVLALAIAVGGAEVSQAYPETQVQVNTSMSAVYAGHAQGAFYVIDSGVVQQFDSYGKLRHSQVIEAGEEFRFSPLGYHYAIIDSNKSDSIHTPYTLYDVLHREVYRGKMYTGGKLFINSEGWCVLAKRRIGSSVEVEILDSVGVLFGSGLVAACDTVVFAPDTRGFMATGLGRGIAYLRLTGERVASYPTAELFDFSVSGRRVVLFQLGVLSFYEGDKLVNTLRAPQASAVKVIYQEDKNRLFLLTKKSLYSLRATDGSELLDYRAMAEGWIYTDVGFTLESELLALTLINSLGSVVDVKNRARQSSLRILTPRGEEYRMIHGFTVMARDGYPRVQMGAKGRSVFFILADSFQRVSW